jgi:hypothetical protein
VLDFGNLSAVNPFALNVAQKDGVKDPVARYLITQMYKISLCNMASPYAYEEEVELKETTESTSAFTYKGESEESNTVKGKFLLLFKVIRRCVYV